jgi:hypothetical protein
MRGYVLNFVRRRRPAPNRANGSIPRTRSCRLKRCTPSLRHVREETFAGKSAPRWIECHIVRDLPRGILDFSIFFLPLLRSPDPRTIMNTRCGTWIHLGSRVAAIQPPHQFLRARALVRYACTATPAPITDMETTFPIRRLRFPYIPGPARKIIRRPAARVNSDEKSRRSIRAGSRLEDRSVSRIREPGTFDSTPLFARVAGQRIFLTPWSHFSTQRGETSRSRDRFLPVLSVQYEKDALTTYEIKGISRRSAKMCQFAKTRSLKWRLLSRTLRKPRGWLALREEKSGTLRETLNFETFLAQEERNQLRTSGRGWATPCTRAETFSNYKRRHSPTTRRRLFLKQEYSSPPRDIMRKREAPSDGAIMAAVMKKSAHPRRTVTPVAPRRRATLVTHLIFRFHGDRLVQRTPAAPSRRGGGGGWLWWWLRAFSLIMRVAPPGRKGWEVAISLSISLYLLFPLSLGGQVLKTHNWW